ncbi:MAG: hypothetical protein U9R01_00850 [candidate division WOR-3 bacterium]|nr:hypothetical protein [candidate division WOR-3 bacterium]
MDSLLVKAKGERVKVGNGEREFTTKGTKNTKIEDFNYPIT